MTCGPGPLYCIQVVGLLSEWRLLKLGAEFLSAFVLGGGGTVASLGLLAIIFLMHPSMLVSLLSMYGNTDLCLNC